MGPRASAAPSGRHSIRCAARHLAHRAARMGAAAHERCGRGRWSARGRVGARLRPFAGTRAVHRLHVCVRGDLRPDSRRDGRRRRACRAAGAAVIPLGHYLVVSAILFAIGTAGVFLRRNLITILLSIEIMLNAVNLTFVAFGRYAGDVNGQIIVFFVITVAAAEAAVGLALVIALFRHRESLNPDAFTTLKW